MQDSKSEVQGHKRTPCLLGQRCHLAQLTALVPALHVLRLYKKKVVKLLKTPQFIQFVLRFDPADRFRNARARPADATHGRKATQTHTDRQTDREERSVFS